MGSLGSPEKEFGGGLLGNREPLKVLERYYVLMQSECHLLLDSRRQEGLLQARESEFALPDPWLTLKI